MAIAGTVITDMFITDIADALGSLAENGPLKVKHVLIADVILTDRPMVKRRPLPTSESVAVSAAPSSVVGWPRYPWSAPRLWAPVAAARHTLAADAVVVASRAHRGQVLDQV